jgi:hypothetical protein
MPTQVLFDLTTLSNLPPTRPPDHDIDDDHSMTVCHRPAHFIQKGETPP